MKPSPEKHTATALREAAEARLRAKPALRRLPSEVELQKLQHELEVHQIELEMLNEELRTARAELEARVERYELAERAAQDGLWDWNVLTNEEYFSPRWMEILGLQNHELLGHKSDFLNRVHPEDVAAVDDITREHLATGKRYAVEFRLRHKDGSYRWVFSCGEAVRDAAGRPFRMVGNTVDITERKQAELELRRSERALKTMSACDQALVHAATEAELLQQVCSAIVEIGGYRMCWVGFAKNNEASTIRVAAVAGYEAGYLAEAKISWSEADERGRGPTGIAFRTGQTSICQDLQNEPNFAPWREEASRRSYASSIALPLRHAEKTFGVVMIYAAEANAFQPGEVALLTALGEDLAYGIQALRTRQQHQQTEAALLESEAKFHAIFDASPVPMALNDEHRRITALNHCFVQTFGYSLSDIPTLAEWWPQAYPDPDYRQSVAEAWQAGIEQISRSGAVFSSQEAIVRCKDGTSKTVLADAVALSGSFAGSQLAVLYDVTESKRAAEQLKVQISALAAAANAIVITNREGKIEWVNPSFTRLTGYPAEEAIGQNPRLLKSGEQPPAFYGNLWSTIVTGNVWHGELVNKRKDGRLYTEEMTITPVKGEDGQIAHFVAVKQDITERRQMEKRMLQAQKMEAIGQLAGGIAHDFNNVLAAMFGYAHLLQQDTVGNPLAQESVAEILTAANRAKDLVQQILTFSRQREQKPQVIKLDSVIKEVIKFLRASLPAHIKIETKLSAESPSVMADPTQIYQVIMNLATNAVHAIGDQPGRLTVVLDAFQPDARLLQAQTQLRQMLYARLTVADTGHGMDAKTLERIFEPFFTTKPVGKGTGLGLAVVQGIVESHNGVITVESQVGQGTTFRLYLPAETRAETLPPADTSTVPHGCGQKILVVDDERALTTMLKMTLHRLGYQAVTSNQASEAIRLVRENPAQFNLVLTDMTMPEMNGLEMAKQIHSIRPELPVILVSGFSASVNAEKLREAGICEQLEKPVSMSALAKVLARVLKQV